MVIADLSRDCDLCPPARAALAALQRVMNHEELRLEGAVLSRGYECRMGAIDLFSLVVRCRLCGHSGRVLTDEAREELLKDIAAH